MQAEDGPENRASRHSPNHQGRVIAAERQRGREGVFAGDRRTLARGHQGDVFRLMDKAGAGGHPSVAQSQHGEDGLEPPSEKGIVIATYALCGFANFSSIAIQIGGISPLAENRRGDIARLGLRALLGGTIATWMTASIAGMFVQ